MENLVEKWDDIFQNLLALEKYKNSNNNEEQDFFKQIIKSGTCFIVYTINDKQVFGPSKFIGYKNNDYITHKKLRDNRDGRDTNRSIEEILKTKFINNNELENQYLLYCEEYAIKPNKTGGFGAKRKYIYIG